MLLAIIAPRQVFRPVKYLINFNKLRVQVMTHYSGTPFFMCTQITIFKAHRNVSLPNISQAPRWAEMCHVVRHNVSTRLKRHTFMRSESNGSDRLSETLIQII